MSDLIKRSDAIKIMACEMYAEAQSQGYEVDSIEDFIPEAKAWINDAPSADRQQGEWFKDDEGTFICSACGSGYKDQPTLMGKPMFKWCPLCGARMKGADDE